MKKALLALAAFALLTPMLALVSIGVLMLSLIHI